eukprot:TRINITY_DN13682_c0_g3_i2.p1 TRINITY_DN13682_c0_g3~~TRINITY_DN13682_c0_g3_i2.p1  ORF type:complete len:117 (-),score=29.42 TRINITY_DN13682_c0_g3_i2:138-461(-)
MALLAILVIFFSFSLQQGRAAPEDIHIHIHGLEKQIENDGTMQESKESGNDYGSVALTEEGTFEECLKNKSKRKCSWEERERKRKHKEWMDCIRNPRIPQHKCFDLQ